MIYSFFFKEILFFPEKTILALILRGILIFWSKIMSEDKISEITIDFELKSGFSECKSIEKRLVLLQKWVPKHHIIIVYHTDVIPKHCCER